MPTEVVRVINPLGLHARAAAQLVRLAGKFQSRVIVRRAEDSSVADAKSILSLLALAAAVGSKLEIAVEGDDEVIAMAEIIELFKNGFGEI